MTFSLLARCPRTGAFGIAAATEALGVGKMITFTAPRVGAAASQALVNPYIGLDALGFLREGRSAEEALRLALARDEDPSNRQAAVLDGFGRIAQHTGPKCLPWAGQLTRENLAAQGNRLTGPETLTAAADAYEANADLDLCERLLTALEAGEAAGGDRAGTRSATLYVIGREDYPLWDVRIDFDERPLEAARRMYDLFKRELKPFIDELPKRGDGHL